MSSNNPNTERDKAIELYRKRLRENKEMEEKMNETRKEHQNLSKQADKSDEHLKWYKIQVNSLEKY